MFNKKMISVTVKTLSGSTNTVSVDANDKIQTLYDAVASQQKVDPKGIRLVYNGKMLSDLESSISNYGIKDSDTIHSILQLRG